MLSKIIAAGERERIREHDDAHSALGIEAGKRPVSKCAAVLHDDFTASARNNVPSQRDLHPRCPRRPADP